MEESVQLEETGGSCYQLEDRRECGGNSITGRPGGIILDNGGDRISKMRTQINLLYSFTKWVVG